jgi:Icc protein
MMSKKILAFAVVCVAVAGLAVATYAFQIWGSDDIEVEGGSVLSRSSDDLLIRCLSPDLRIDPAGFSGNIRILNCFPGSVLTGHAGSVEWNGTTLSFSAADDEGELVLAAPAKQQFSFAVMGDSQGHNDILQEALNMTQGCGFIIHCGDLTPSGAPDEFAAVEQTLNGSGVPVFTTPGNHDVKNYGSTGYLARFGPTEYSFDYGGVRFAFVDSSDLNISEKQITWLERTFAGAERKVVVTHAPCYDPIEGNHTLDPASCERFEDFALGNNITAVFTGHIHAFYSLRVENTDFVITGGAGGSLTAGAYHWVRVNVTSSSFNFDKVDIDRSSSLPTAVTVKGHGITVNFTLEDLNLMEQIGGYSSFQNNWGNIKGQGTYVGVEISTLLCFVGNMSDGETLRVTATDLFAQEYGYGNVYPNSTWLALQGQMILAISYNSSEVPTWQDGPRIAMLPSDGLYDNNDCNQTSYPGQGYWLYASAGWRWVSNVALIEVVS